MENIQAKWYSSIIMQINTMAEKFGLDDMCTQELRDSVIQIAKEQFKAGNKSGIRWAYSQVESGKAS